MAILVRRSNLLAPITDAERVNQAWRSDADAITLDLEDGVVESRKAAPPEALETIPPFGVEANRKAIQLAIDWSLEQRIIPHRLEVDELFDDATRRLVP